MKKIYFALLSAALILTSCVEHMEEVESTQFAGIWAVVDEYDMASTFYVFDKGYFIEYNSIDQYYVHDEIIWGAMRSPDNFGKRYKYSAEDGFLCYNDYFKDVKVNMIREGNELIIGEQRCRLITNVKKPHYSKIALSESNKTTFLDDDTKIEWDYQIVNPLYEYELEVVQVPQWCGDVSVEDGKIYFTVEQGVETRTGKFVLSYPTAGEMAIDVKRGDMDILAEDTYASFQYMYDYGSFSYTVQNPRKGASPVVYSSAGWIRALTAKNGVVSFTVEKNDTRKSREGKITLSYDEVVVEFEVTQASQSGYGYWIGEWLFKDQYGHQQKVRIRENIFDSSYRMTGYGGLSNEFAAVLQWNADNSQWELRNQVIGYEDLEDGNASEVWMYGGSKSGFKIPENNGPICHCVKSSGTAHKLYTYDGTVDFISLASNCNGEWTDHSSSDYPEFPITINWAGN